MENLARIQPASSTNIAKDVCDIQTGGGDGANTRDNTDDVYQNDEQMQLNILSDLIL